MSCRVQPAARRCASWEQIWRLEVSGLVERQLSLSHAGLLAAARPRPAARALRFVSAEEPYEDSLTLEQAAASDAMSAYGMDGEPLVRNHGAPARVVMPRMYGYKGVKWVRRIVVTDRVADGYWQQRGSDRDAWIGYSNGL